MKLIEIITLRCPSKIDGQFIDELLNSVGELDEVTDTPGDLVEMRMYHHSLVETDLSIHIYWETEAGKQNKSSLGLIIFFSLKSMGLVNHSVWIERAAREIRNGPGN